MKYITRTIKSTVVNVYGINPTTQTVEIMPYLFDGDYSTATDKDIAKIKKDCMNSEFIPAYTKESGRAIEKKYAISIEVFMKYAHVVEDGEKVEEA